MSVLGGTRQSVAVGIAVAVLLGVLVSYWLPSEGEISVGQIRTTRSLGQDFQNDTETSRPVRGLAFTREQSGVVGVIVDETDAPVDRAEVCLVGDEASVREVSSANCVRTSSDGEFALTQTSLDNSSHNTYELLVSAEGYLPVSRILRSGERLRVVLRRGGHIVRGRVEDATAGVIAGAAVSVTSRSGDAKTFMVMVTSNDAGVFTLTSTETDLTLSVVADGYANARRSVTAPSDDFVVKLAPGSSLSGTLLSAADATPVVGVSIEAERLGGLSPSFASGVTGTDGSFEVAGLGSGVHSMRIKSSEWSLVPTEVALGLGDTATLELTASPATKVSISVSVNERPCSMGHVRVEGPAFADSQLDGAGEAELGGLPPGEYTARTFCVGALPHEASVELVLGKVSRYAWTLEAGASVAGRVTPHNPELGPLVVFVEQLDGDGGAECSIDTDGAFYCGGLKAGQYTCGARAGDLALSDQVQLRLKDAQELSGVELVRKPAGSILVSLQDQNGAPIDNAVPTLTALGRAPVTGSPLGLGKTEFAQLPAGTYILALTESTADGAASKIEIRSGQRLEFSWKVDLKTISGTVRDGEVPQPDVWVGALGETALGLREPDAIALTDSDGRFVLSGLVRKT